MNGWDVVICDCGRKNFAFASYLFDGKKYCNYCITQEQASKLAEEKEKKDSRNLLKQNKESDGKLA